MKTTSLLSLLLLLAFSTMAPAGQWFIIEGAESGAQGPGTYNITGTGSIVLTQTNDLTVFLSATLLVYNDPNPNAAQGAGVTLSVLTNNVLLSWPTLLKYTQVGGTLNGIYFLDYAQTATAVWSNTPPGTINASFRKGVNSNQGNPAGAVGGTKLLVYAPNEYGPSDNRILAELASAVTNLQGQITTVSNQLATAQLQINTNTQDIATLQGQYNTLTNQYLTLSNQLANIPSPTSPSTGGLATQSQINALDSKYNKRTNGLLGGTMWNDVVSFGGLGIGAFSLGNQFINPGRAPIFGDSNVPQGEARPGYYDR